MVTIDDHHHNADADFKVPGDTSQIWRHNTIDNEINLSEIYFHFCNYNPLPICQYLLFYQF